MMLSSMTRSVLAWKRKLELIRGEQGDTTSSFCKLVSIAGGVHWLIMVGGGGCTK